MNVCVGISHCGKTPMQACTKLSHPTEEIHVVLSSHLRSQVKKKHTRNVK